MDAQRESLTLQHILYDASEAPAADVTAVVFSPDGGVIAGGINNDVWIWETATGVLLRKLKGCPRWIGGLGWLAVGDWPEDSFRVRFVVGLMKVCRFLSFRKGHCDSVSALNYSPDGQILASGGNDGEVKLWDARSGRMLRTIQRSQSRVRAVAVSPDGVNVAVGEERGLLSLRDLDRGSVRWEIQAHRYALDSVAFSPDGSRVVTTCGVGVGLPPEDVPEPGVGAVRVEKYSRTLLWEIGEVKAWDLGTGAPQWSHSEGRPLFTYGVAWSPDGTRIATAGNELRLWDGETGERQRTVAGDPLLLAMDVAFSPEGKYLVTVGPDPDQGSSGGALRLWDVETGAALQTVAEGETLSLGNTVAWSPRGDLIGCGGYGHMRRGALSLWRFG